MQTLREDFYVLSLLKLKNKSKMVAGGHRDAVSFWNTITFTEKHTVECCGCSYSFDGLIELFNDCVAVSSASSPVVDVIDAEKYKRIQTDTM